MIKKDDCRFYCKEQLDELKEDNMLAELNEYQWLIWLHSANTAFKNAALPSISSPLGSNLQYQIGIAEGEIEVLDLDVFERGVPWLKAPGDKVLLSFLENSWNGHKKPGNLVNYGFHYELMPDT